MLYAFPGTTEMVCVKRSVHGIMRDWPWAWKLYAPVRALPRVRPVLEEDKAVPVKVQKSAVREVPTSKLGFLTTCVGAGVGVGLEMDVVVVLGVDAGMGVEESTGEVDGEGFGVTEITVERVELGCEILEETTTAELDGEDATGVLGVEEIIVVGVFEEAEAAWDDDTMMLVFVGVGKDGDATEETAGVLATEVVAKVEEEAANFEEAEAIWDDDTRTLLIEGVEEDNGTNEEDEAAEVADGVGAALLSR
jgi:hypothetical protein